MDLRVMVEPQQGTTYDRLLALATRAESLGYDGFFSSDHYMSMWERGGRPGPTDAWTTMAGLARDTSRLRLGTLVSPVTFRHPGNFAIAVAQTDQMSGGRIELGLGAGWYEAEHRAHAIPFPPLGDRFDMLEEQLAVITGLWATADGETFSFTGNHYEVSDSPGLPKPLQRPRPPIVIGGSGARRTPRLAAAYADEFNAAFKPLEQFTEMRERVHKACEAHDRDPATMIFSVAQVLCCGRDGAEVERRAAAIGKDPGELSDGGIVGTADECAAKLREFSEAGASRVYLQVLDDTDLDHLDLVMAEVSSAL
jgi:F420-dependent oxidoreductase-like protein